MTINASGWRPERPEAGAATAPTFTGNKALMLEEPLIFEIGSTETTGVDFDSSPGQGRGPVGGRRNWAPAFAGEQAGWSRPYHADGSSGPVGA
jgi:hypothetical protein